MKERKASSTAASCATAMATKARSSRAAAVAQETVSDSRAHSSILLAEYLKETAEATSSQSRPSIISLNSSQTTTQIASQQSDYQ